MPLPDIIRVKLSTEAAGSISVTPVVARDMPLRELVELMLGLTGKDPARVHELLLRGTLVSSASRFRWSGWDADRAALESLLATFPGPEPDRVFSAERSIHAALRGPYLSIELTRQDAPRRAWAALMDAAAASAPQYLDYSHSHHADCFRFALSRSTAAAIRQSVKHPRLHHAALEFLDLYVAR